MRRIFSLILAWSVPILTFLAAILRFTNLNWDAGERLHPDETLLVNGALTIRFFDQLFPGFHDYNGFPVYLLKIGSLFASFFSSNPSFSATPEGVTLAGRMLSALLSTLTVPLLYLLGKRLWNKMVGSLAALLFAFAVLPIQLAHFYTTESILVFLLTLLSYLVVSYGQTPAVKTSLALGIVCGLMLATKNTAYFFLPIPFLVLALGKSLRHLIFFLAITPLTFFLTSPYSFLDAAGYIARSTYLAEVVSGKLLFDWTIQFQGTSAIFWGKNLLYALGPAAFIGLVGTVRHLLSPKEWKNLSLTIFAFWALGFTLFLALTYVKFIRYDAPLVPYFSLFAAKILWDMRRTLAGAIIAGEVILTQLLWGAMFFQIYLVPHTSMQARHWIAENVPAGAVILEEDWNRIIQYDLPQLADKHYRLISFNFYTQPDSPEKILRLTEALLSADYLILNSPKVANTVRRLRKSYPYSGKFYEELGNGNLGFTQAAQFSSYPRLGPLVVNDEGAEETFTVFDHPTVTIYQKTAQETAATYRSRIISD